MISGLPFYITALFCAVVIITIIWQYAATKSKTYLFILIGWAAVQTALGFSGIYTDTMTIPPKILLLGFLPPVVAMLIVFFTKKGKAFVDSFNLKTLTYSHSIRIPVEVVLALLFHQGYVSRLMTFEGTNFDLFSGITASIVAYIAFKTTPINRRLLIGWNILCLLLLLNVVITAVFCIPTPFQKFSFDQPNVAILYFPFNLLPALVVPVVLFGHLVALRRLLKG
jgi:hypothetical protein